MSKYKETVIYIVFTISIEIIKIALSALVAWLIAPDLIAAAAKERGYEGAFGSEWFLIIGAAGVTYYLLTLLFKAIRGRR